MRRTDVLNVLGQHLPVLRERFGVREVAVFGSTARDEASDRSDIDVLVTFETGAHVGFFKLAELKDFLEGALDMPVDLLTPASLHPRIRDRVLKEAVRAG